MDYVDKDFGKILKSNAQTLRHELLPQGTDCFRVYDRNLSRYPVTVDIYGRYAKVTDYGQEPMPDADRETCLDICARMLYLEPANVVYSHRVKRLSRIQPQGPSDSSSISSTALETVRTTVKEHGLIFSVDLTTYIDTGLFLDQAVARAMVQEQSVDADVLNLFSYTGSFSVYAAAGGAKSVTSVDLSATYTRWAEENLQANGFVGPSFQCLCMDASKFVSDAISKGLKYDIIIFDPPSFSNSRKMESDFDVSKDHVFWIRNLTKLLRKSGFIFFSTNLNSFILDKGSLRGLRIKDVTGDLSAPGFVKGRVGTARSWIMGFDDDSLSLDWSEPTVKTQKGSTSEKKSNNGSSRNSNSDGKDRSKRARSNDWGEDRFDDESQRGGRSRDARTSNSDKPYGTGRGRRNYNCDGRSGERRSVRDKDKRDMDRGDRRFGEGRSDGRTQEKSYDGSRNFGGKSRYESYGEKRNYHRDDDFKNRKSSDKFDGRSSASMRNVDRHESYRRVESKTKSKKPYGYDSFKPARSRSDSSEFFWNEDDLDPTPRNDDK